MFVIDARDLLVSDSGEGAPHCSIISMVFVLYANPSLSRYTHGLCVIQQYSLSSWQKV
jgi:hypothetical protein